MRVLNLIVLVLLLTGCSALQEKFVKPPHTMCDKNESLLMIVKKRRKLSFLL